VTLRKARFALYLDGDEEATSGPLFEGWHHGPARSLPYWEMPLLEPDQAGRFWTWFTTEVLGPEGDRVAHGHEVFEGVDTYWVNFDTRLEFRYLFPRSEAEGRVVYDFGGLTWVLVP
jgi:hypothetical protein